MRLRNAFKNSVFEAPKLVTTKTLLLKHYYRHQGSTWVKSPWALASSWLSLSGYHVWDGAQKVWHPSLLSLRAQGRLLTVTTYCTFIGSRGVEKKSCAEFRFA